MFADKPATTEILPLLQDTIQRMGKIDFGDTVRIRSTAQTEGLGLAGRTGVVYGITKPSITGVQVIGSVASGRAFAVKFEGRKDALWFDPNLVEYLNHTQGTTITIGGKSFTRDAGGGWIEDARVDDGPTRQ